MNGNEWVNSEKEACSASFSYWAATGKSTGWNWPPGWKRSHEAKRHLVTSFLGLFYPTLTTELKSETMTLVGVPSSQSVRLLGFWRQRHLPGEKGGFAERADCLKDRRFGQIHTWTVLHVWERLLWQLRGYLAAGYTARFLYSIVNGYIARNLWQYGMAWWLYSQKYLAI